MPLVPIKTVSLTEVLRRYPPRFPDFIPRRCGKTEAMRRMLDHPYFTQPTPISYFQKEPTMRLTKAQKAANAIAIAKAKDEQHLRLIERLQQDNIILGADNAKLSGALTARTSELHTMAKLAEDRARDIAAFKQEVLALTTENATLRGYMARVLEDDTVREVGGAKQSDTVLCDEDRSHMQQALHQDNYSRRQPPRSVRTGPWPPVWAGADMASECDVNDSWNPHRWDGRVKGAAPAPKHWLQR